MSKSESFWKQQKNMRPKRPVGRALTELPGWKGGGGLGGFGVFLPSISGLPEEFSCLIFAILIRLHNSSENLGLVNGRLLFGIWNGFKMSRRREAPERQEPRCIILTHKSSAAPNLYFHLWPQILGQFFLAIILIFSNFATTTQSTCQDVHRQMRTRTMTKIKGQILTQGTSGVAAVASADLGCKP